MIGAALEAAVEQACDVRAELVGTGAAHAIIYVDAAIRSMRHARASLIRRESWACPPALRPDGWVRLAFADGSPTAVLLQPGCHEGTWLRGVVVDGRVVSLANAEVDWKQPTAVDLGNALLTNERARSMAARPVGAALLLDAIGYASWYHPETTTRWTAGLAGARAIVSALSAGAVAPRLASDIAGLRIDQEVLGLIESLGWRRDPAARWRVRYDVN